MLNAHPSHKRYMAQDDAPSSPLLAASTNGHAMDSMVLVDPNNPPRSSGDGSGVPQTSSPVVTPSASPLPDNKRARGIKVVAFVVYFIGTLASTVMGKRTTIAAPLYPFALTLLSPLAGLCVYPLIVGALSYAGHMTAEQRRVPWWKPCIVGVLFSLYNVLENLGNRGDVVPGPIVLVLMKSIVPITFAASYIVPALRPRYRFTHYAAVVLLLAGIALSLGSELSNLHGFVLSRSIGFIVLLLVAVLPLAAAFIFIEVQLKHTHPKLHPTAFWMYLCVFEALFGIPLAFLNAKLQGLGMSEVWSNAVDGMQCYVAGSPSGAQQLVGSDDNMMDVDCSHAQLWFYLGLIPGFASNLAMPVCTKYGSATLLWFVRALALPAAAVLFSLHFIMGSYATSLSLYEWFGLAVVFGATVLYNHYPTTQRSSRSSSDVELLRGPQESA